MQKPRGKKTNEQIIATLKTEKEELESSLNKEKLQTLQLKEELTEAETRNTDIYKVITGFILEFALVGAFMVYLDSCASLTTCTHLFS